MQDVLGRPDWNTYFMSLCYLVSQRSLDPSTKHGCVVVAPDNTILVIGYNGPPRGCNDSEVPLTRPEKYPWMVHSEEAAIANAAKNGISLDGSTFYITGYPCSRCLRGIINAGARMVIYGARDSACLSDDKEINEKMIHGHKKFFALGRYKGDMQEVADLLVKAQKSVSDTKPR